MGFENGKLVRVVLKATLGEQQEVMTLHYDLDDSGIGNDNDPQALADRFRDDVIPVYKTFFRSDWTLEPVEVVEEKDPQNPTAPRTSWTSGTTVAGTNASSDQLLHPAHCAVITLKTAQIGRRHTGRIFMGGSWNEGDNNAGAIVAGTVTGIHTLMDAIPMQPDIVDGGAVVGGAQANWCVYSRTQRAADLDPYASHITSYIVRPRFHWLRSREDIV